MELAFQWQKVRAARMKRAGALHAVAHLMIFGKLRQGRQSYLEITRRRALLELLAVGHGQQHRLPRPECRHGREGEQECDRDREPPQRAEFCNAQVKNKTTKGAGRIVRGGRPVLALLYHLFRLFRWHEMFCAVSRRGATDK